MKVTKLITAFFLAFTVTACATTGELNQDNQETYLVVPRYYSGYYYYPSQFYSGTYIYRYPYYPGYPGYNRSYPFYPGNYYRYYPRYYYYRIH